ncbi:hypothetical protein PsYK624_069340 [Phanerochaete sordida]|uniref:DUF6534 domain-containing protein n=1 Tax=Phanerochaete sordida TaxID=48140 RepID=A0A9P3LD17_9APHY|nr:hypothetical protein PsYK624_069340 [Phanerochaete sordida]
MIYTVNTGLITSVFAVADVTTCAAMPNNFIFVAIYFLLNGLYSNSLLASLNARDYLSRCHESGMTPAPMTSIKFAQSVQVMESGIAHTESSEDGPGESEKL